MRKLTGIVFLATTLAVGASLAGEAEIKAAQSSIDAQLRAFQAGDSAAAYSSAAPNVTRIFPTVEAFMGMVNGGYTPLARPQRYAFGKSNEPSAGAVTQQVLVVGPDGKEYEAIYTLERQPDGSYKITGVHMRESKTLST